MYPCSRLFDCYLISLSLEIFIQFYYYSIHLRVLHTSVSWWFLLDSEWQQVSSNLQDSSQYSGCSQQCWRVYGLDVSPYFNPPVLVLVQIALITIAITVTFMFHSFFSVFLQDLGIFLSFRFPTVLPNCQPEGPIVLLISLDLVVWPRLDDLFAS